MSESYIHEQVSITLTLYKTDDTANTTSLDYASGIPRHHHGLYIDDGNIVIQVYNRRMLVFTPAIV